MISMIFGNDVFCFFLHIIKSSDQRLKTNAFHRSARYVHGLVPEDVGKVEQHSFPSGSV